MTAKKKKESTEFQWRMEHYKCLNVHVIKVLRVEVEEN